jgi:hypothetical protein
MPENPLSDQDQQLFKLACDLHDVVLKMEEDERVRTDRVLLTP